MSGPDGGLVLAVDGGGTKTDVALVGLDGAVRTVVRGPAAVPQVVGVEASVDAVAALARGAATDAGLAALPPLAAVVAHLCGIDLEAERTAYADVLRRRELALADRVVVENDAYAVLHAGTPDGRGLALVCGSGASCLVVAPDGAVHRYLALGATTGDRAGGHLLGVAALGAAARAADGRGPRTALEQAVPAALGRPTPDTVAVALHVGELSSGDLTALPPVVVAAARAGDAVAAALLDEQADELARTALALVRPAGLDGGRLPVVLGGGLLQAAGSPVTTRLVTALRAALPGAEVTVLDRPPVLGAARAALRLAGAAAGVVARGPTGPLGSPADPWARRGRPRVRAVVDGREAR